MKKSTEKRTSPLVDEVFYTYHVNDKIDDINKKLGLQNRNFIYL